MKLHITLGLKTDEGDEVPPLLIDLLNHVNIAGSLAAAAQQSEVSYRTAWNLINNWSEKLSVSLLESARGKGAKLTAFGHTLLWASVQPESKLSDSCRQLEKQINRALLPYHKSDSDSRVLMYASDCPSLEIFLNLYRADCGQDITIFNSGSGAGLQALAKGQCHVSGFHIADSGVKNYFVEAYRKNIDPEDIVLLKTVSREQGMIVAAGNPLDIGEAPDLVKNDARLANRQQGAGTRVLLDALLEAHHINPGRIAGYGNEEITHSAVCARIAGDMADVALATRASATSYGLGFIPLLEETYYFTFRSDDVASNPVITDLFRQIQNILSAEPWRKAMAALDGYHATGAGEKLSGSQVLTTQ